MLIRQAPGSSQLSTPRWSHLSASEVKPQAGLGGRSPGSQQVVLRSHGTPGLNSRLALPVVGEMKRDSSFDVEQGVDFVIVSVLQLKSPGHLS